MAKYIDKIEFHNLLKEYKEYGDIIENTEGEYTPQHIASCKSKRKNVYNKLGVFFLLIATNYLNKPSYINYSYDWKDDMISEAVLDMVRYIHNYDVDRMDESYTKHGKIPDPFSYFSQYARNGINRLLKERKKDNVLVRLPFIENMDKREFSYE